MPIPKLIVLGNFLTQQPTGVQRYAIELTRALSTRNPGSVALMAPPRVTIPERLLGVPLLYGSCLPGAIVRVPGWAFLDAPLELRLRGTKGALVWNPSNIGAPHVPNQILTLHDLSFYHYPDYFSWSFRAKHRAACAITLPRVRAVTTVSQSVRQEIESKFPFLRGRVGVVPNGVSDEFRPATSQAIMRVRQKHNLPDRFFFCLGSMDPRKNLKTLIAAFAQAGLFERSGTALVIGGGRFSSFAQDPDLSALLRRPGVRHLGYVEDGDLPALYSGCRAFVFPSVYEGFGIPLIEALACGASVVCSDIPVFREIGKNRVSYFSARSIEALALALLAADATEPRPPVWAAETSEEYSWQEAASKFESILRGMVPSSPARELVRA